MEKEEIRVRIEALESEIRALDEKIEEIDRREKVIEEELAEPDVSDDAKTERFLQLMDEEVALFDEKARLEKTRNELNFQKHDLERELQKKSHQGFDRYKERREAIFESRKRMQAGLQTEEIPELIKREPSDVPYIALESADTKETDRKSPERAYSREEEEGIALFARTGDVRGLIPLEKKELSLRPDINIPTVNPDNPLGLMVLNRLTSEADHPARIRLGQAYLEQGSLMKASCEEKGMRYLFGAKDKEPEDGYTFLKLGEQDYGNGNYVRAIRFLEAAADRLRELGGNIYARGRLAKSYQLAAEIYMEGKPGVPASVQQAAACLTRLAEEHGSGDAAWQLGRMYREGKKISADGEKARRYLTMAANREHIQAGVDLTDALFKKESWTQGLYDEKRILKYLQPGIKKENPYAIFYLGLLSCIQGNADSAVACFLKLPQWSIAKGLTGQLLYQKGDYQRAVPYLKEACEDEGLKCTWEYTINSHVTQESRRLPGLTECMGMCYAGGYGGCERDYRKAIMYLEDAAAREGASVKLYETLVLLCTQDLQEDHAEKAVKYWLKAQKLGSEIVSGNLGLSLSVLARCGKTDGRKKELANQCLNLLLEKKRSGNVRVKYALCCYFINFTRHNFKEEFTRSDERSHWYYTDRSVFSQGDGRGHLFNEVTMDEYLDEAVREGITGALYIKGRHYLKCSKPGKAYECFQKSAEAGDKRAETELPFFKKTLLGYTYEKPGASLEG